MVHETIQMSEDVFEYPRSAIEKMNAANSAMQLQIDTLTEKLKARDELLERAKYYVSHARRDSRKFPWHEEDTWLSDLAALEEGVGGV